MMAASILQLEHVTGRYGGVIAVDDVSLAVPAGIVFGIIGPNGAGKTSLFNLISGFARSAAGRIVFDGTDISGWPVEKIAHLGIARTFQNIALLGERTVRENLLIGLHLSLAYSSLATLFPSRAVEREERNAQREIGEVADMLLISRDLLDSRVDTLSIGQQKRIEVARAILRKPKLLLLDEPAGGLNDKETADLKTSLEAVRAWCGASVILVDHDMNLVMSLCQRVVVLNRGAVIAEGTPGEIQRNPDVVEAYLGHG